MVVRPVIRCVEKSRVKSKQGDAHTTQLRYTGNQLWKNTAKDGQFFLVEGMEVIEHILWE